MFSVIVACAMGLVSEIPEGSTHLHKLATISRDELMFIERLRTFRIAVEKLPESWSASGLKSLPKGAVITKAGLVREIEKMELQAAERWNILLENTALIDKNADVQDVRATQVRKLLESIPKVHEQQNDVLNQYNTQMKDGILNRLASSLANKILQN